VPRYVILIFQYLQIKPSRGHAVISCALGVSHSMCIMKDGTLFVWGSNETSQLGLGVSNEVIPTPTRVVGPLSGA
jgi:alpha-tubulin suppressor-like RCC1 family protein